MSFESTTPEPKKYYLDLLIKLDFIVAEKLFVNRDYIGTINGLAALVDQGMCWEIPELKETIKKIDTAFQLQSIATDDLMPLHRALKKWLNEHWFSELHLGIIPTSTVKGDMPPPADKVFDPNQSSRLR